MNIKNILLAVLMVGPMLVYAGGGDTLHSTSNKTDKFAVAIQSVTLAGDGITRKYEAVPSKRRYNAKANYYWYRLKKNWAAGQQYRLVFKQVPLSGVLYIFSVDGTNTPKIYGVLNVDSMHKGSHATQDMIDTLNLKYAGQERLCIWYAKNELEAYEDMIMGIEFTHGEFIERNNIQLGHSLLLNGPGLAFRKRSIGFTSNSVASSGPAVLPVVIEFEIK